MSEENTAIARRVVEEVYGLDNLDAVDQIYATSFVVHAPGTSDRHGTDNVRGVARRIRSAFPDVQFTIEDQIAEGDKVVTRFTWRGTHQGEFIRIPPTGKPVSGMGVTIMRIVGGKIVEAWDMGDRLVPQQS